VFEEAHCDHTLIHLQSGLPVNIARSRVQSGNDKGMARIVCHAVRLASGKLPVTFNEAVWSPASQELLRQFGYEMEVDYGVLHLPLSYRGRPALSANELKGLGHW
jgi:hypothetical protein